MKDDRTYSNRKWLRSINPSVKVNQKFELSLFSSRVDGRRNRQAKGDQLMIGSASLLFCKESRRSSTLPKSIKHSINNLIFAILINIHFLGLLEICNNLKSNGWKKLNSWKLAWKFPINFYLKNTDIVINIEKCSSVDR